MFLVDFTMYSHILFECLLFVDGDGLWVKRMMLIGALLTKWFVWALNLKTADFD